MNRWLSVFAHSPEFHSQSTSEFSHIITEAWFIVSLTVIILALIWLVGRIIKAKVNSVILAESIWLLVVGIFSMRFLPSLALISLVVGFSATLYVVLINIGSS